MKRISIESETHKPIIAIYCYFLDTSSREVRTRMLRFQASAEEASRLQQTPAKRNLPLDYAVLDAEMRADAKWGVTHLSQVARIEIQRGHKVMRYFVQGVERNGVEGHVNKFRPFADTDVLTQCNLNGWVTIEQRRTGHGVFDISADVTRESTRPEMSQMIVGEQDNVVTQKHGRLVVCNLKKLGSLATGPI